MPEFALFCLVGAIIVFIAVNVNLYIVHKNFSTLKISTLNHNLSLVKQYWSIERGQLISFEENESLAELKKKDHTKATRSAFIFGTFMIALSWLGLFFFSIYLFSVHKLAKTRLEKRLFASPLIQQKFSTNTEVEKILSEFWQL